MDGSKTEPSVVQFGPFELNSQTGELRRQGIKIKLQRKPLQILRVLIKNPHAVVTREELRRELWPEDTFVDFESGVNTAVNRLRAALGDSAESPRYIETLARTGYRFLVPVVTPVAVPDEREVAAPARPSLRLAVAAACLAVLLGGAILLAGRSRSEPVRFQQLTYRRGQVSGARFAPSQGVVYAAQWERDPRRLFFADPRSPVPRVLGFEDLSLQAVSPTGELAVLRSGGTMNIAGGTLSRAMMNGGPSQLVAHDIFGAEWFPDGTRMALVRAVAGAQQLEFPAGRPIYKTPGWMGSIRISPSGQDIAFIDHPARHDDAGTVKVIDTSGNLRIVSEGWASAGGLAWRKSGEVWFTATRDAAPRSVWALMASGKARAVGQAPGSLTLRDIAPDGQVLVTLETRHLEIAGLVPGAEAERDLSLTDWSRVQQLSADGSALLFDESGEGSGSHPVAYIRDTRTGPVVRLGDGWAESLSPDGSSALLLSENRAQLRTVPVSGGAATLLPRDGLQYQWARFFPDGQQLLALAALPGEPLRLFLKPLSAARGTPLTGPLMARNVAIAPDGKSVAVLTPQNRLALYPVPAGDPQFVPSSEDLAPLRWSRDGKWLFVQHLDFGTSSALVSRIRVGTGEAMPWKTIVPEDRIGVNSITGITIADDERSYAYSYRRVLSSLYLATGWR
jgi:DNA-binding winged helix-turn-helix (wHTH) protein